MRGASFVVVDARLSEDEVIPANPGARARAAVSSLVVAV
jgi:hypothetical protein